MAGFQHTSSLKGIITGTGTLSGKLSNAFLQGMSAYDLAVESGFEGTVEEWLESLKGDKVELREIAGVIQWKYTNSKEWLTLVDMNVYISDTIDWKIENAIDSMSIVNVVDQLPAPDSVKDNTIYVLREG